MFQERYALMTKRNGVGSGKGRGKEAGFALVVAILALMLLTFIGLALAATTSTELQIATNYRWSQQALYNAEAGLQVAKLLLMNVDWNFILPPDNRPPWTVTTPANPVAQRTNPDVHGNPSRNFAFGFCDRRHNGMGAGAVLDNAGPEGPYQNVSSFMGQTLNGSFTLWVKRPVIVQGPNYDDDGLPDRLILTVEGTAPYQGANANSTFARANRAVRLLEVTLTSAEPQECGGGSGQKGLGSSGAGFNPCVALNENFGTLGGRLTGQPGAGTRNQGAQAAVR
jgi:PilX N-terminal